MKKHWPTLLVIFCIILYMVGFFWYGLTSHERNADIDSTKSTLETLMKVNLQMPNISSTRKTNNWLDLEPISQEEWMNIDCKLPDKDRMQEEFKWIKRDIDWSFQPGVLTDEEKKYLYCISPGIEYSYKNMPNNQNDFLLPNDSMFNEPCIIISFHEYILQYPKILRNILKIAEKPCYYLKNSKLGQYYTSRDLRCDSFGKWPYRNEKTCIIIRIVDSEVNLRHQIVVPRRDNNHLFNLK